MKRNEPLKIRLLLIILFMIIIGFAAFNKHSRQTNNKQLSASQISRINSNLTIITSTPAASSNPHDQINAHKKEYDEIVQMGTPVVDYFIQEFKRNNLDGSKEWITAWICNEILGDENPIKIWSKDNKNGWSTGRDWYKKYIQIKQR